MQLWVLYKPHSFSGHNEIATLRNRLQRDQQSKQQLKCFNTCVQSGKCNGVKRVSLDFYVDRLFELVS